MPSDIREQLVKYLTDAHAIEEQALTQLRRAPGIAGDPQIAAVFDRHLGETERQEQLVRKRLEAHGAEPSTVKDIAGKVGGYGMVLFARFNPDTPGKLVNHAYSYEHMELAAYELLARVAGRAGDEETAAMAREIAGEEQEMANRLESCFDLAVAASLRDQSADDLDEQLNAYLADAHAIEKQAVSLLEGGPKIVGEGAVAELFERHLEETREHLRRVEERLEARGSSPSTIKDVGLRLGGFNLGGFFGAQPDTPAKLTGFAFAFEHLEVAAYEQLGRVAQRAADSDTTQMAQAIAQQERAAARQLAEHWDDVVGAALEAQKV
jgi:ferritin-like metal-binding protein YciE